MFCILLYILQYMFYVPFNIGLHPGIPSPTYISIVHVLHYWVNIARKGVESCSQQSAMWAILMLGDTSVNYSISHHLLVSPFLLNVSHSWVNVSGKGFIQATMWTISMVKGMVILWTQLSSPLILILECFEHSVAYNVDSTSIKIR